MPNFYHTADKESIVRFMAENFKAKAREQEGLFYFEDELAVRFGNPKKRSVSSISLFQSASPVAKKAFAALKRQFHVTKKEAYLKSLGPEFYKEYFGEDPP